MPSLSLLDLRYDSLAHGSPFTAPSSSFNLSSPSNGGTRWPSLHSYAFSPMEFGLLPKTLANVYLFVCSICAGPHVLDCGLDWLSSRPIASTHPRLSKLFLGIGYCRSSCWDSFGFDSIPSAPNLSSSSLSLASLPVCDRTTLQLWIYRDATSSWTNPTALLRSPRTELLLPSTSSLPTAT